MSDGKDGKDAARPDLSIGPQARGEQESAITQETDTVDSIVSRMPPLTVESAVKGLTLRGSFTGTTRDNLPIALTVEIPWDTMQWQAACGIAMCLALCRRSVDMQSDAKGSDTSTKEYVLGRCADMSPDEHFQIRVEVLGEREEVTAGCPVDGESE